MLLANYRSYSPSESDEIRNLYHLCTHPLLINELKVFLCRSPSTLSSVVEWMKSVQLNRVANELVSEPYSIVATSSLSFCTSSSLRRCAVSPSFPSCPTSPYPLQPPSSLWETESAGQSTCTAYLLLVHLTQWVVVVVLGLAQKNSNQEQVLHPGRPSPVRWSIFFTSSSSSSSKQNLKRSSGAHHHPV